MDFNKSRGKRSYIDYGIYYCPTWIEAYALASISRGGSVDIINIRISKYTELDANAEAVLFGQEDSM